MIKVQLIILNMALIAPVRFAFAQFIEDPEVSAPINEVALDSSLQVDTIFHGLIIVAALMFVISMFGFVIGFLKMITAGGDEITAETGSNILVLSGWIFGASALSYLVVNLVKYFIY